MLAGATGVPGEVGASVKITISSTDKIVRLDGVPARIWEGTTESGIAVHCFVTRVAVPIGADQRQFERELTAHQAPSAEVAAYPLHLVL